MLLLCLLGALADGGAEPPPTPAMALAAQTTATERVEQLLEDGQHVRFGTETQGPVHAWKPTAFKPQTAGIVVYVHGFFSSADSAFFEHRLATQFRDSGRNAVFVVPEAPSGRTDPAFWDDLEALLKMVFERTKWKRPDGPITLVAHSGAYRTVVEWLAHPKLKQVVMIDALYAGDRELQAWLEAATVPNKQLVLVGFETQLRTDWFLRQHPKAVKLDDVPYLYDRLPALTGPVLSITSDRFDHMALITDGRVLPYLLHALPQ